MSMKNTDELIREIFREEIEDLKRCILETIPDRFGKEETRFLTRKQVSKYLSIGISTVDYWTKIKKLRKIDVHGIVRFDKIEIDQALQQGILSKYKN